MANHIIIHAGQHKTGSTSLQHYLANNRPHFQRVGIFVCPGWTSDLSRPIESTVTCNVGAVAHAIVRNHLLTPGRLRQKHPLTPRTEKTSRIAHVNAYLRAVKEDVAVLSAEAFSYLREPEEFQLVEALCDGMSFEAVMFLREPQSWMASWQTQVTHSKLIERPGAVPGRGIFDFSETSWLTDHDAIRSFWGGTCHFLNYEDQRAAHGSIVPAFLREIGVDPAQCPAWDEMFLNTSARKLAATDRNRQL